MKKAQKPLKVALIMTLVIYCCPFTIYAQDDQQKTPEIMNTYVSIFEIPAVDIERAIGFYQQILSIDIQRYSFEGIEMGVFPYEEQLVTGVIMKADGYQPSANGLTIYLNGGNDLQLILDKVEKNGGKIIAAKTPHADGIGYFALFSDSEGNRMGLHSPN